MLDRCLLASVLLLCRCFLSGRILILLQSYQQPLLGFIVAYMNQHRCFVLAIDVDIEVFVGDVVAVVLIDRCRLGIVHPCADRIPGRGHPGS